jgi:hypothetical protein
MKKVLIAILGVCFIASAALATNEVYSVNAVGFMKKGIGQGGAFNLVANQFETDDTNTLKSIYGDNQLRQSSVLAGCDKVIIWNPTTDTYQTWAQWLDGNFYKANNQAEWDSIIVGNPEVPIGAGMWLVSSGLSTQDSTVVYSGDVIDVNTQAIAVVDGFQQIGYPYTQAIALNDMGTDLLASGAAASSVVGLADKILVWNSTAYQTYALWLDGNFYKANNQAEWDSIIVSTRTLDAAEGAFYVAKSNFTWTVTNKYDISAP